MIWRLRKRLIASQNFSNLLLFFISLGTFHVLSRQMFTTYILHNEASQQPPNLKPSFFWLFNQNEFTLYRILILPSLALIYAVTNGHIQNLFDILDDWSWNPVLPNFWFICYTFDQEQSFLVFVWYKMEAARVERMLQGGLVSSHWIMHLISWPKAKGVINWWYICMFIEVGRLFQYKVTRHNVIVQMHSHYLRTEAVLWWYASDYWLINCVCDVTNSIGITRVPFHLNVWYADIYRCGCSRIGYSRCWSCH